MEDRDNKKSKLYKEWFWGSQYDLKALCVHFEQMAAKGLMFKGVKGLTYCYERCEPKKVRFCVDCFDKATGFDTNAEPETLEYIEYCEKAGWHYICTNGRLQYFYTEESSAVPIRTDSGASFKSVVRNTLRTNAVAWFVLPAIYLFTISMWLFRDNYYSFVQMATDGIWHSIFFAYIFYIIIALTGVARFLIFYFRNKKIAREGGEVRYYSVRSTKLYGGFIKAMWVIAFLGLTSGIMYSAVSVRAVFIGVGSLALTALIIFIVIKVTTSKKATRAGNIAFTVVLSVVSIYLVLIIVTLVNVATGRYSGEVTKNGETYRYSEDKLPITMAELGVEADEDEYLYEETTSDKRRGLFASLHEYGDAYVKEDGEEGWLAEYSVDVFRSKSIYFKNKYEEKLAEMGEDGLTEVDGGEAFGCRIYKLGGNNSYWRYLKFEDCQVFIKCSWELSERQLEQLIKAYGF